MFFLITYLKRLFFLILLYSASRIYFFLNNIQSFNNVSIKEFIEGFRFDVSALMYINVLLLILILFPTNFRKKTNYIKFTNTLFYIINIPFIIINNIDIVYFQFTQKRSTIDLLQLIQLGEDAQNIIPQYLKDYWLTTLFTIIQIWFLLRIRHMPKIDIELNPKSILKSMFIFLISTGIFVLGARGGIQLKPIKPINAGELTNSKNTGLILNTPFCILHSLNKTPLKTYKYFNSKELKNIYSSIHLENDKQTKKSNIIILIMESYSKEFIGYYNNNQGYTPFLDSLMQHSLVFTNAYANGLKSIEALPAITASIPTLLENPFITSDYAQNNFESIASILNQQNYNTSFYHGGIKGTMGFYSFTKKAGFNNYFGKEEYPVNGDFDGTWGVYDGPFMQFYAKQLNSKKEPFFSTFFSLSSHPPYDLPIQYKKKHHPNRKVGIRETVLYSDQSMKNFFQKIKNHKWFENTIFIITADHTSPKSYNKEYKNKIGRYKIPLIIFKNDGSFQGINTNIVQHIDIMPTVLELLNYNKTFFSFGKSMFSKNNWAIHFIQDEYRLITNRSVIVNKNENYKCFSDWNMSKNTKLDFENIQLLKAIKQDYNSRMLNNKLSNEN